VQVSILFGVKLHVADVCSCFAL